MEVYQITLSQLEDVGDTVKVAVLKALMLEGKINEVDADKWCETHTVVFRKKTIFQTISNLWRDKEELEYSFRVINEVDADKWCETHTIVVRKKTIFQTISNLWRDQKELENVFHISVVKQV
jgi:hypothetical protein